MTSNPSTAPEHALRLQHEEAAELARLATEHRTTVDAILLAQLGSLRKLLRTRINAGLRSHRSHA